MECITTKRQIAETFNEIVDFSDSKKDREQILNNFLDRIRDLQLNIDEDSSFLEGLVFRLEKMTWFDFSDLDDETLQMVRNIFEVTRQIHKKILMNFVFLNKNAREYAPSELKRLKSALDNVKESVSDTEEVFFILPKNERFQKANQKLQSL